ncbi:MAG: hypothetical protein NVSMB6_03480 [Burkholderiaceae bacterium]
MECKYCNRFAELSLFMLFSPAAGQYDQHLHPAPGYSAGPSSGYAKVALPRHHPVHEALRQHVGVVSAETLPHLGPSAADGMKRRSSERLHC